LVIRLVYNRLDFPANRELLMTSLDSASLHNEFADEHSGN
jgi:hypothetical protein